MKRSSRFLMTAALAAVVAGCRPSSRPFVKFDEIAVSDHYPDYWIADTLEGGGGADGQIAYLNALVKDHDFEQALYFCNTALLTIPDPQLRTYVVFKRAKIEFLSHFISHYGTNPAGGYRTVEPRTHLRHSSLASSLNRFLASQGIDTCALPPDTAFASIGYPTEADVRYALSLIAATRDRVGSIRFADSLPAYQAERDSLLSFLNDFELEIVSLGVWKYAQNGTWDSATAYCDYMAERYPALKDNLLSAKAAMDSRPRLKKKPPAVAGVLSALVPGAGQIYAGKVSDGLMLLLAEGIQVGCAAYLLNGVDVERERSEMVLGVTLSLTSVATYIGSIKNAVSKTEEYNTGLAQKEIEIFADSLRTAPPGYLR